MTRSTKGPGPRPAVDRTSPSRRPAASGPSGPGQTRASTASSRKSPARRASRHQRSGRGPASADLLGLLILTVTVALAACGGGGPPAPGPELPTGEVTVRFLDVGQGDAVLVQSPEGKTLLVDGGRSQERMRAHLSRYGVSKIDLMVASHADADHIAGLIPAAQTAKPTLFINNGIAATTQTYETLISALQAAGTTFEKAGTQVINLGSVKVRIIAPPPGMGDDQNLNSVGVAVQFGNFRALMTGDSERKETDAWLAQSRPELQGPVQVYKSIHHGAANGDHQAWLAALRPENVVISVGDNSYGHPTQSALDLYAQNGVRIYRTDQQGTMTFRGRADGTYTASLRD